MSNADVMTINPSPAGERRCELDVRLTQVMDALDRTRGYQQRWRVVARGAQRAQTPRPESNGPAVPVGGPDKGDGEAS